MMDEIVLIIKGIIDGCENVISSNDLHKDAKTLASLIIKDCNLALKKANHE